MVIDKYLLQNKIKDYEELSIETMQFLGDFSGQIYNENFSRDEKWELENEPDQKIIGERLRGEIDIQI